MKTSQFESVKVALKQDRTGFILTLSIHPDEIPEEIIRDFVGARYQVVMVRIDGEEQPMNREQQFIDPVKLAGILCKDKSFQEFLVSGGNATEASELAAIDWIRNELGIQSRAQLKNQPESARHLFTINEEFKVWKRNV